MAAPPASRSSAPLTLLHDDLAAEGEEDEELEEADQLLLGSQGEQRPVEQPSPAIVAAELPPLRDRLSPSVLFRAPLNVPPTHPVPAGIEPNPWFRRPEDAVLEKLLQPEGGGRGTRQHHVPFATPSIQTLLRAVRQKRLGLGRPAAAPSTTPQRLVEKQQWIAETRAFLAQKNVLRDIDDAKLREVVMPLVFRLYIFFFAGGACDVKIQYLASGCACAHGNTNRGILRRISTNHAAPTSTVLVGTSTGFMGHITLNAA